MADDIIAELPGRFVIRWIGQYGSCDVDLSGFWSAQDVDQFYPAIAAGVRRSKERHGYAIMLFDTTQAQVMAGPLFNMFEFEHTLLGASDRVAVVVSSSLLKMQLKRLAKEADTTQYFISRSAAETWIHAHVSLKHRFL